MTEFTPGDLGFVVGEMISGPLDGQRYRDLPVLPGGLPPFVVDVPLGAEPFGPPRAVYRRMDDDAVEGRWRYLWQPGPADAATLIAAAAVPDAQPAPA
ncbi:MAG TPA: hypothetical protein VN257_01140 [Actinotalea sp.]|nr:hypothetical protein [Actinotalea sp.]